MELFKGSTSKSSHEAGTELIKCNEIRELPFDEQLVFIRELKPVIYKKTLYFKEDFLLSLCDRNPMNPS